MSELFTFGYLKPQDLRDYLDDKVASPVISAIERQFPGQTFKLTGYIITFDDGEAYILKGYAARLHRLARSRQFDLVQHEFRHIPVFVQLIGKRG